MHKPILNLDDVPLETQKRGKPFEVKLGAIVANEKLNSSSVDYWQGEDE